MVGNGPDIELFFFNSPSEDLSLVLGRDWEVWRMALPKRTKEALAGHDL